MVATVPVARTATIWEVGLPQGHVEVRDDLPSPAEFHREYVLGGDGEFRGVGRPVLLQGAAQVMPAYQRWTDVYLRETYGKVVLDQVETEKAETRTKLPHEDWTVAKFLDNYKAQSVYSTAKTPAAMGKDIFLLPFMNCGGYQSKMSSTVLWMSSGDTKSVIHNDGQQNIHCMIAGEKKWIMWRPDNDHIRTRKMGWISGEEEAKRDPNNFKDAYGAYVGLLNVKDVDLKRFPGWGKLRWWSMDLRAGDCAFIPSKWYHFVEAPPQRSISSHVWFHSDATFDGTLCTKLEKAGRNVSDYLFRVGDCQFDEDIRQKTKCRLTKARLPQERVARDEL